MWNGPRRSGKATARQPPSLPHEATGHLSNHESPEVSNPRSEAEEEQAKALAKSSEDLRDQGDGQTSTTLDDQEDDREPDQSAIVRWQKHHQLSILDFLSELSEGLNDEHLDLEYDYFGLFRRVWKLLEAIQTATMPLLQEMLDEHMTSMMASEEGVSMVPGVIMLMASDPRNALNLVVLKNWIGSDDSALKVVAHVMKDFMEREGSVEAERQGKVLEKRHAEPEIDAETKKALDEIESIRAVTGAVPIEDEYQNLDEMVKELLDARAFESLHRVAGAGFVPDMPLLSNFLSQHCRALEEPLAGFGIEIQLGNTTPSFYEGGWYWKVFHWLDCYLPSLCGNLGYAAPSFKFFIV